MKPIRLLAVLGLLAGVANGATVTVSAGLPAQGFVVTSGTALIPSVWEVGYFETVGSMFTRFGTTMNLAAGAELSGAVAATSPTSLNGQIISVYVGTAPFGAPGAEWIIFKANANTAFPADVSGTAGVTFNASVSTNMAIQAKSNPENGFVTPSPQAGSNAAINLIPESSAVALSLLGALGLLRRRR